MFTNKHRFTTILTAAFLGIFAIAALVGCGNTDNNASVTPALTVTAEATPGAETTPEVNATPTAVATPSAEVTSDSQITPTTGVIPTSEPTLTVAPTTPPEGAVPENLPTVSFDQLKAKIDREIETDSPYVYMITSTYQGELGRYEPDVNYCGVLKEFDALKKRNISGFFKEDICYMDSDFREKKHDYILEDGTRVTLYITKYGYALDNPEGGREYICMYDEDAKGQRIFLGYDYMDSYSCYSYDENGNIVMKAYYYGDGSPEQICEYAYDARGNVVSERTTYRKGADYNDGETYYDSFSASCEYDESDNLIVRIHDTDDATEQREEYVYHKDSDNRLTGWTLTITKGSAKRAVSRTEYFVKYYTDGSVAIYCEDASAMTEPGQTENTDYYTGMVFVPNEELRNKMATTSHLHADYGDIVHENYKPFVLYPEIDENEGMIDYDTTGFFGIPTGTYEEGKTLIFCIGELSRKQLDADTFAFEQEDYWYAKHVEMEDGLLISFVTGTYSGISYDYQYDDQKRLINEKNSCFDIYKNITYTYDGNGMLIKRVRDFEQVLSGPGDSDLRYKTTYRYSYDAGGKLTGMTATTVDETFAAKTVRESVLTLCR